MLDLGLYIFYVLLFIAVAAAVIFPLLNSIKEPKALIRTGCRHRGDFGIVWDILWLVRFDVEPKCYYRSDSRNLRSKLISAG